MSDKKLIILAGPSGSGKTSVARKLLQLIPKLSFSISATTRTKRHYEQDGVDYHFLSETDFRRKIDNNEFVEFQEVYPGLFYGTLKWELERIWKENKYPVLDVDVIGALNIKENVVPAALALFVHPVNIENLENRLQKRATENEESLQKRLARAETELSLAERFDKIVYNENLDTAVKEAENFINNYISTE